MERRNFIKRLLGIGAAAALSTVPALAKKEDTFTWEDLAMTCTGNKNLFYIKQNSWLNQELMKIMGDRVVDRKYFSYYDTRREILIPVKDIYKRRLYRTTLVG